jgi:hypothetical protein
MSSGSVSILDGSTFNGDCLLLKRENFEAATELSLAAGLTIL